MATLLHSETRRLYSWWWDSHISPKNSKWLQKNLKGMDAKVKAMIRRIEEDADSFARRAKMYDKKRPELAKLVQEFKGAYHALAERYDHATAELRHVQKTMAQVFDNQMPPFMLPDESSISEAESHTPEIHLPNDAPHGKDDLHKELGGSSSTNQLPLRMTRDDTGESSTRASKDGLKDLNEVDLLNKEIEKCKIREKCLSLKLQERRDEFELWEAEATTFYFYLQISSIRELLYEHKVQELALACENAGDENAEKNMEIEQLRERVSFQETEVRKKEAQLSAYKPAIAALREDVESLMHSVLPQTRDICSGFTGEEGEETTTHVHHRSCNDHKDEIFYLHKIGAMIKVVEKAVIEEKQKLNNEYDTVEQHIKEVKEAVLKQVSNSGQLKQNLERSSSSFEQRPSVEIEATGNIPLSKLREQAQRGSKKKPEAEKKRKGKNPFPASKLLVILKDFIWRSGERSERCYCGCMRPTHVD